MLVIILRRVQNHTRVLEKIRVAYTISLKENVTLRPAAEIAFQHKLTLSSVFYIAFHL